MDELFHSPRFTKERADEKGGRSKNQKKLDFKGPECNGKY